jgi:hypothetical protein
LIFPVFAGYGIRRSSEFSVSRLEFLTRRLCRREGSKSTKEERKEERKSKKVEKRGRKFPDRRSDRFRRVRALLAGVGDEIDELDRFETVRDTARRIQAKT